MSCCGGKRAAAWPAPVPHAAYDAGEVTIPAPRPAAVPFEYTGRTALTMRGAITGRSYRFAAPGETVAVDPRDAPGAAGVPNLRRVRASV
ncbi:MAG TPA: hypothetical protein VE871_21065 [Longimicrobium sp.]|nr:hypothetical protein [Longimicrobium sp.]